MIVTEFIVEHANQEGEWGSEWELYEQFFIYINETNSFMSEEKFIYWSKPKTISGATDCLPEPYVSKQLENS